MPVPSQEDLAGIVSPMAQRHGFDLEEVRVSPDGQRSSVAVVVDADTAPSLDILAQLSREVSEELDALNVFGEMPYVLEVTSPGVDRPLTMPRHWRRARGRKVAVRAGGRTIEARVGALVGDAEAPTGVQLIVVGADGPTAHVLDLAEVKNAVVQVEFSSPDPREVALAMGTTDDRHDSDNK
ncbi:ribosome maturation factor RimP [Hoyosella rhizosphaerae]|uniref:Ribosome maturation factor RimP n=1 Tax=Hoyosella rhizosphaerae TaxID=1755582 RepID=A0A916XB67_9ACTN|nr:ribosome maturation factor RimP [Hoyosella rhizosphaerae]MBN4926290.1 ribosome maturation factor RimP [Hoyosella rhizosphaerae]GGC60531.1 ribosome maturation factor RimP [Hoyosella rhizosphaerae]